MKIKLLALMLGLALTAQHSSAQGTLFFDQESSTDENYPVGGGAIQFYGAVGQSFVPSLSSVGFVRLKLYDIAPGNSLGAGVVVNLRSNAINGSILDTTPIVSMTNGFSGSINFIFANPVAVVPGLTYFLEVAVISGDNWGFTSMTDTYASGNFYGGAFPFSGADLWFREGVIVPEPSSVVLVGLGGIAALRRRKYKSHRLPSNSVC